MEPALTAGIRWCICVVWFLTSGGMESLTLTADWLVDRMLKPAEVSLLLRFSGNLEPFRFASMLILGFAMGMRTNAFFIGWMCLSFQ